MSTMRTGFVDVRTKSVTEVGRVIDWLTLQ